MKHLIFDIETVPLPDDKLIKPEFVANKTLKDPEKVKADLAAKELDWRDKLALDATTCRVAMIGTKMENNEALIRTGDETEMLVAFWMQITNWTGDGDKVVGFNSNGFDLPVICRRSWALGVSVPSWIRKGRYFADCFIDLMEIWTCGNKEQRISLANLSRFLGVGEKSGSGADFGKLTRDEQIAYLKLDLELTAKCAAKLIS